MPSSGPGLTLLMLLVLPLLWALPMALVCSELGSALPEEGGYYAWTRRAMGEFWGFQCGWWSWTCQWVDSAVYIALVQGYVATWWPQLNGLELWLIGAALIAVFAYINIRGLNIIALSSVIFTIIIVAPFLVLIVLGPRALARRARGSRSCRTGRASSSSTNLGLAVGVWMYSGYDSMSTLAGEIENPRRLIPKALMIAMPIVVALVLPAHAGRPRRRGPLGRLGHHRRHLVRGDGQGARRARAGLRHAGRRGDQQHGALPGLPRLGLAARLRHGRGPAAAQGALPRAPQVRHALDLDPVPRPASTWCSSSARSPTSSSST